MIQTCDAWIKAYTPVMDSGTGKSFRSGQAVLGEAIISAFTKGTHLIGQAPVGVGKSHALLVPMITKILEAKANKEAGRGIISTETLGLQNQVAFKDLPELQQIYPGFTYAILKGRSNYYCADTAKQAALGNNSAGVMYSMLEARMDSIQTGEKYDIERVLGFELSNKDFSYISGSTYFCNDNGCQSDRCFTSKAREKAMASDIVVINHALLQTDIDMKGGGGVFADGLLGEFQYLAIDEAHTLADVLTSGWTETLSEYELNDYISSVSKGVDKAKSITPSGGLGKVVSNMQEDMQDTVAAIISFYHHISLKNNEDWDRVSYAVSEKVIVGAMNSRFTAAMAEYEEQVPLYLHRAEGSLAEIVLFLQDALRIARENELKGVRDISKGLRAAKKLAELVDTLTKSLTSKDGIVFNYGINYGIILDGWVNRQGGKTCTLRFVPLDIAAKAKEIWAQAKSCVLVSGTMSDLETGSFDYVKASLGFPTCDTLTVDSPFDFASNQLVYITKKDYPAEEGTKFALQELCDLLVASNGRALVLFTSKRELELATNHVRQAMSMGQLPYFNLFVQDSESDKKKLAEGFRSDIHSVLFGLKSFFTGVDFPGETLSLAVMVRFPLPRLSVECRMMMKVWAMKGFRGWYSHKALEDFQQIGGRLIRSVTDKGVIAILDQRLMDQNENVYKTAKIGVSSLGSPVTQQIEAVSTFLS